RDFWKDPKDPHKTAVYRQYTERPFVPMPSVLNPGFTQLQNENVFAKAIGRMVVDKWDSKRAIDEMIARIKAVGGGWAAPPSSFPAARRKAPLRGRAPRSCGASSW